MLERPFRLEIGPYRILLPGRATVTAEVKRTPPQADQIASTLWRVMLDRFQLLIHLDPVLGLGGLKSFIDYTTRSEVVTPSINVNGVPGVTHGGYGPPHTWIDWWFKKGDVMICLCLQDADLSSGAAATGSERAEHRLIIESLTHAADAPDTPPPPGSGWT